MLRYVLVFALILPIAAVARDNGQWANSPLKPWMNSLASKRGLCCSFADGMTIPDVDWDTFKDTDGKVRYRVRLENRWVIVPDDAVIDTNNLAGVAIVWPYLDALKQMQIRCFLRGIES